MRILIYLLSLLSVVPVLAADPGNNIWHFLEAGDRLYSQDRATLLAVGVVQDSGESARIYFVPHEDGAVVSLSLPDVAAEDGFVSTLRIGQRGDFRRHIASDELVITGPDEAGDITFNFAISETDIGLFMAATNWEIKIADQHRVFTMKGSRSAIEEALAEKTIVAPPIAEGSN